MCRLNGKIHGKAHSIDTAVEYGLTWEQPGSVDKQWDRFSEAEPEFQTKNTFDKSQIKQLKFMHTIENKTALRNNCGKKCILAVAKANPPVSYCWAASTKQLKPY